MTGLATSDIREWSRWIVCGLLVLAAHGGAAAMLANVADSLPPGSPITAIMIELAPDAAAPAVEQTDLPVAPLQEQSEPQPEEKPIEKVEKEPDPKVEEPPPPPTPPTAVALPEPEKPRPEPKPQPKKKVAVATAPQAAERVAPHAVTPSPGIARPNSNAMPSWKGMISAHLQRHKSYPAGARSRREEGTAVLSFTIDRSGRVVSAGIARGSGHADLDQETLAVVRRAQPFPAPPADVSGRQFPFTVPMRYYLR